ncbi:MULTISPECIES: histidine phosphatase family protein [Bradyrhizobium]|uniref:histidine phosphatase family protein n=1 Tax=Bradyrhizobium TaxID=374 RepID=UPI001EDBA979|nr:histidine phosphatase family protein [Bradyrhizobium zhengyangense]MCG2639319.1 histidine phosphatase family protein [Bradyrhizobium zhengyangense]
MNVLCRLFVIVLLAASAQAAVAADTTELIASLKQGGYVLVFRHTATDDSQKDVYPFKFDDMSAQRQLSEKGRDMARQIGVAIRERAIPIGNVYTSRLNRAIEAGKLITGKEGQAVDALTDSSNASASGMANPQCREHKGWSGRAPARRSIAGTRHEHRPRHAQDEPCRCLRQGRRRRSGRRSLCLQGQRLRPRDFRGPHQSRGLDGEGRPMMGGEATAF